MTLVAWQLLSMTCFQILFCYSATVEIEASQFSLAHGKGYAVGHVIVQNSLYNDCIVDDLECVERRRRRSRRDTLECDR